MNAKTRRNICLTVLGMAGMLMGQPAFAQDKLQIWAPRDAQSSGAFVIAQEKQFFKNAGLDTELKFVSSGQEIPAGIAGGTIKLAIASWTNAMAMNANGIPVRVLARVADISPALGVLGREKAGIKTAKDLEGKKVGATRISVLLSVLEKGCAAYGCDMSKITIVNMQPQEIVLAYERGDVDAVLTNEPWTTYVHDRGGKWLFSAGESFLPGKEGPNKIDTIYTALLSSPDFVKTQSASVEKALRGLREAAAFIKANPDEAAAIIGKVISIPTEVARQTLSKVDFDIAMTEQWANEYNDKAAYLQGLSELRKKVVAKDVLDPAPLRAVCPDCVKLN